jgi:hypothetical protein
MPRGLPKVKSLNVTLNNRLIIIDRAHQSTIMLTVNQLGRHSSAHMSLTFIHSATVFCSITANRFQITLGFFKNCAALAEHAVLELSESFQGALGVS